MKGLRLPDVVSITGAGLCIVAGLVLALTQSWLIAAVLFGAGSLCDLFDGKMARRLSDKHRPLGSVIDAISDKAGELGLFIGLVVAAPDYAALSILAYGLGLVASWVKVRAVGTSTPTDWRVVRVFGRASRVAIYVAMLIAASFNQHNLVFGLGVLLIHNGAALLWRLNKVRPNLQPER